MDFRLESDSIGEKKVPKDAYYGVQSLRGKENFKITGKTLHREMIIALAMIKKAAAISNHQAGVLSDEVKDAIVKASDEIIAGKFHDEFICDPIQGGAGTTANMNANEVIANRAEEILGGEKGSYSKVHPNDHVNMAQSTNDVYPTSGKLGAIFLSKNFFEQVDKLTEALDKKAKEFDKVIKMGRTQLQDAVPIRLGQEFLSYRDLFIRDERRIKYAIEDLKNINMGASAIGTGINVSEEYLAAITENLSKISGLDLKRSENLVDGTCNLDCLLFFSSSLKTMAVNLSKMSNDFRLLSSGPRTMVGDINLPPKQNGSSIMPGKVNPVIPEVVNQAAFKVIGNDVTIGLCAEGGQLQLNAFEPVLFYSLFESIEVLTGAIDTLVVNCIEGITANEEKLKEDVEKSTGIITALVPHIGYTHSARIAKESLRTGEKVRSILEREKLLTKEEIDKILDPFNMTTPGIVREHLL